MKNLLKLNHFKIVIIYSILSIQPALAVNFYKDVVNPTTYVNIYIGKIDYLEKFEFETTDEIGVFVDDGDGGKLLVGACNLGLDEAPDYYRVEIYGDDDPNDGIKNGAYNDDELLFELYKPISSNTVTTLSTQHFSTDTPPEGVNTVTFPLTFVENQMPVVVGYLNFTVEFAKIVKFVSIPCLTFWGQFCFIMIIISAYLKYCSKSYSKSYSKNYLIVVLFCILYSLVIPDANSFEHFTNVNPTNSWIDYAGKITVGGKLANSKDEIAIFIKDIHENEIIVGAASINPVNQEYYMVHVFENDSLESKKNGACNGDELIFKFWHKKTNTVYNVLQSDMTIEPINGAIIPSIPPVYKPGGMGTIYGQLNISIPYITYKCDLNKDGKVNSGDVIFLLKGLAEKIP